MSISAPFIRRPIATSLLAVAVLLAGGVAFFFLPVSPLPEVEYPTISVSAGLPGASPETMASAVATPLERQFGRIAGITEMTSSSSLGSTNVTLQFDLNRDIDSAARDVQAAINAARGQLPANLPSNPSYRKTNPADAPIMILALTSDTLPVGTMYDAADSLLAQKIAQVPGVGQVSVGGGAKPAVRVQVNPIQLASFGLGLEDVRTALAAANANSPKGQIQTDQQMFTVAADDQLLEADKYRDLIIAYRNDAPVRLKDVANVFESQENIRNAGLANGKPAVLIIVFRQPGANIIDVVDRIKSMLPLFQSSINPAIHLFTATDRTTTIRASVHDVEATLLIAIGLVVIVIFLFLRNIPATFIPAVAVPLSLVGTLAVMYLLNYTLDNLSLMALTIATGFVVDDAIVVIENIARYIEQGLKPFEAALKGAGEIGFTVFSMSMSLVAVFIPILLMGGIIGRLFREFAVVLAVAILVSLAVSLTVTPMMSAKFLVPESRRKHGRMYRVSEKVFETTLSGYGRTLKWVLQHSLLVLFLLLGTVGLAVYLYVAVPKGFFPQQDTGRLTGSLMAAQDISFEAMRTKQAEFIRTIMEDPAVDQVVAFNGSSNRASAFIQLKPLDQRKATADQIIARLRPKLSHIPGAQLFLQSVQDVRVGGRGGNAQYQYTLQGPNIQQLNDQVPILLAKLKQLPQLRDVNSDQQNSGLESYLAIDRETASRLGIAPQAIDATLYDAFGQRQVSTLYKQANQYHVVMEVQPEFSKNPDTLKNIYVKSSTGISVPLSTFTHYEQRNSALSINHQGQFPATTITFNLAPGLALGDAVKAINQAESEIQFPGDIHGGFQGTAAAFEQSLSNQPLLIAAALAAVYIVLGMLYESLIHPITILSTLPSAGVGALLALLVFRTELNIIALIGIILLIGIVKKNAIMMIDFALVAERSQQLTPDEAIFQAAMLRFRPIMMTTLAALFGALPLAFGTGVGSELRRPLGITIVGGLLISQVQTLFTTPIVYLYMDRMRLRLESFKSRIRPHRRLQPAERH
jgi:multidrug efflux pump